MINQEELKRLLTYNTESGDFTFNIKKGGMNIGDIAGYVQADGYRAISCNGVQYKAHRLAWLYITGSFPDRQLDHINMNKGDNRFCNLREATRSQNHMNRVVYANNKLGCKGVHRNGSKFRAMIKKDNKQICLGLYDSIEQAKQAYDNASVVMHGEFSRLQ